MLPYSTTNVHIFFKKFLKITTFFVEPIDFYKFYDIMILEKGKFGGQRRLFLFVTRKSKEEII